MSKTDHNINLGDDILFKLSIGALWFSGVCYMLLGLVMGATFLAPEFLEAVYGEFGFLLSAMVLLIGVACAVGNFAVAHGLGKRKRWAWVGAVVIGGLYAPSGCFIIGILILVAMLRSGVRESYLAECEALESDSWSFSDEA